jgi:hypothetical protein
MAVTRPAPLRRSRVATAAVVLAGLALGCVLTTPAAATDIPPSYSPIGLPVYSAAAAASQDGTSDPAAPTQVTPPSAELLAGDETSHGPVAYLTFTAPTLPANASNISAFVVLSQVAGGVTSGPVKVYSVVSGWSAATLDAANAPALGQLLGRAPVEQVGLATEVMVSAAPVQPGQQVSFAVTSSLAAPGSIAVASAQNPDPSLRPQLLVTYLLPPDCSVSALLVPSCGAWFGSTANPRGSEQTPADAVARQETELGRRLNIVHAYHSSNQDWPTPEEVALVSDPFNRRMLMVNWKPENGNTWAQVAAGASDAWIDTVAARIQARLGTALFFLAIHHEPENEVLAAGSGFSAADYVAMFRHVVQRLRADGVSGAVVVWDVMGFPGWGDQGYYPALYPGDDVVDWIGYDPYSHAGEPVQLFANRPGRSFPGFYTWATSSHPDKPLMLAEFGVESAAVADKGVGVLLVRPAGPHHARAQGLRLLRPRPGLHHGRHRLQLRRRRERPGRGPQRFQRPLLPALVPPRAERHPSYARRSPRGRARAIRFRSSEAATPQAPPLSGSTTLQAASPHRPGTVRPPARPR